MKKVIAINGSPRKKGNTVTLLQKAMEGAESAGAETEMIHLYDLNYKGCTSCFSCKRKDSKYWCKCAMKDDLSPILERVMECDAILLGSPIYLYNITGEMQSFIERLIFMNLSYDKSNRSNLEKSINVGCVFAAGMPAERFPRFQPMFEWQKDWTMVMNGKWEYIISLDSYQFKDYSKYAAGLMSEPHKRKVREEQFPIDCQNAYELGRRMTE